MILQINEDTRSDILERIERYNKKSIAASARGDHNTSLKYQKRIMKLRQKMQHMRSS